MKQQKKKKISSFGKQFIALVKGDDAAAQAERVNRQRMAGLNTHLQNAKGDLVDREESVKDAEELLAKVRLNHGNDITDRDSYVKNVINAKEAVLDAKDDLASHQALITSLEEEIALF